MVIEKVDYSHLVENPDLRDGSGKFEMVVTYPGGARPSIRFTRREFLIDKKRLTRVPVGLTAFIIGTFTAFYDPELGRLPDEYTNLIKTVHQTLDNLGIFTYSCFVREDYGRKSIGSGYATVLDGLALRRSRFLTMLPGASISDGTWKEVNEGMRQGIDLISLFRESSPEIEFRQRIMETAAFHGARSKLTFITFAGEPELVSGLTVVATEMMSGRNLTAQ